MVMKKERKRSPFWEADCYLQKAQDAISKSLHELASITAKDDNKQNKFPDRHRQSSAELHCVFRKNSFSAACASQNDLAGLSHSFSSDDGDVAAGERSAIPRRKRFTRRQRRNLTGGSFGERTSRSTSALNCALRSESTTSSSSNDDDDNDNDRVKRSAQLTNTRKSQTSESTVGGTAPTFPSSSSGRNYVNSGLTTQSVTEICCKSTSPSLTTRTPTQAEPVAGSGTFQKFKGPAARKAHRRTLRSKLNPVTNNQYERKTGSHARLDFPVDSAQPKKDTLVRRSVSVRELNGTMIDFTNQDSVTRWTSQILAEIDSLPSSRFDLTEQQPILQPPPTTITTTTATVTATASATATGTTPATNVVRANEQGHNISRENFPKPLQSPPSGSTSDISIEMGILNSTPSPVPQVDEPQPPPLPLHRSQDITVKSGLDGSTKFQKRNSWKKNIWRRSMALPEASCTANIVLLARPSSRRNQSVHAIVVSARKNPEKPQKTPSWPQKSNSSCNSNLQSCCTNPKGGNNNTGNSESSRLWRFLSRKKRTSLKKCQNLQQNVMAAVEFSSVNVSIQKFGSGGEMRGKNSEIRSSGNNDESKWAITEMGSDRGLPVSRTNLSLAVKSKPNAHYSQMSSSAHEKLSGYAAASGVEWRSSGNVVNVGDSGAGSGTRTCLSMESINLRKDSGTRSGREPFSEPRRIRTNDEASSPLTVWKRRAKCRAEKFGGIGGDGGGGSIKEVNSSTGSAPSSSLTAGTAVQSPPGRTTATTTTTIATTLLNRNLNETVGGGSGKSVHGIVASLIRAAEETRFQAPDKPKSLNLSNSRIFQQQTQQSPLTTSATTTTTTTTANLQQQETGTQTSPYSLSRSSSFDWINESSTEDQHSEELIIITPTESPGTPEDPEYAVLNRPNSSTILNFDETLTQADLDRIADEEVQGMLRRSEQVRRRLLEERNMQAAKDIDDSIAMLLEYAEDLNVAPNREAHYPLTSESLTKLTNDIRNSTSATNAAAPRGTLYGTSRNRTSSVNNQKEFFRRFTSSSSTTGNNNNSTGQQQLTNGSSQGSMSDSIYDNVPHGIRQAAGRPQASLRSDANVATITSASTATDTTTTAPLATIEMSSKDSIDSTPTSAELNHCSLTSYGTKAEDSSTSPNGTKVPQRDVSVSSGLADSESSPLSPAAPTSLSLRRNGSDRKQQTNATNKNKCRVAPIEINSSYEVDTGGTGKVRSPPPPSPRSSTEKRRSSVVLASDLFAFSTGRVPERAESCEELDVDYTEQNNDELYLQKKQKAEEEAVECVRWLRDAGFPQYARLYEEHRFPIDIRSVQRDHEFLDDDSLRALFRRLNALNRCAIMKVENVVLRKHPERFDINPVETDIDDDITASNYDDDDDQVAISNKWKYQRNSQTWSRIVCDDSTADAFNGDGIWSSHRQQASSVELDGALRMSSYGRDSRKLPDGAVRSNGDAYRNRHAAANSVVVTENDQNRTTVTPSSAATAVAAAAAVSLQRSQSERLKERARALMRRMDIRSSSRRRRQRDASVAGSAPSSSAGVSHHSTLSTNTSSLSKGSPAAVAAAGGRDLVIGDPVLVSHFSASPQTMRMFPDGLSSILSSQAVTPQMLNKFRRGTAASVTAPDDHASDGVTFAVLQPSVRQQQQQQQMPDYGTAQSRYSSVSPSTRIRTRFLGASNRRMGMVLDAAGSPTTAPAPAIDPRRKQLRRNRPRDMSCDPSLMRGLPRHDRNARIYDRVARDDLYCDNSNDYTDPRRGPPPADLLALRHYDRHSGIMACTDGPSSPQQQQRYANNASFSSLKRSGLQISGDVLSDSSLNYNEVRNLPRQDLERHRDRNLALPEQSYARSRLIVNADGYYEHIPTADVRGTALELSAFATNLDDSVTSSVGVPGTSAAASGAVYHRAISPASSSSNASVSNHANRLKVEIDGRGGKRLGCGSGSPSSSAVMGMSVQRSHSSLESSGNDDELTTRQHRPGVGERRDSGVGSSLSRSPSGPTTQRQRNSLLLTSTPPAALHVRDMKAKHLSPNCLSAFRVDHNETFVSDADLPQCMDALSVAEMQQLRKLAFLKLSVMIETYAGSSVRLGVVADSGTGRVGKSWAVHKFIRRMRNNDNINNNNNNNNKPVRTEISTFGLPLAIVQSRSGFALPRCVLEMMRFLRAVAPETVGIFRKSGVRSRISELRLLCDVAPEVEVFTDGKDLDSSQVHDIADLLKQYFRELPEPLMTAKYSEAFAKIFIHVPAEMRLEALQHAVLLLPDEHREALQTLLYFLHDIAKHSATNSMTPQNLAVCFAPSLFQLCGSRLNNISPTRRHKTIGASGLPTEREIKESRAAQECLVQMIEHCTKIFIVPNSPGFERDGTNGCYKSTEPDAPFLTELGLSQDGNYRTYLLQKARELLKEHRDRWKGWIVEGTVNGVEISTKKSTDGHPLRFFRVWVDVEAPPKEILARIIRERSLWDTQTINWRTVATLSAENCDVFQYVINDTPSHPTRDAMVVRLWRADMKELRGGCVLVERSVHSSETQLLGGLPAAVLSSQFLVEPIAGRSRVTYISRIDLRGRSNVWYSKVYGQLVARQLSRLRDSFKQFAHVVDDGPETKV